MPRQLTLLTICQDALSDVKGYNKPSTIVGNDNDDAAVQLLRAAKKVGRELATKIRWQALMAEYTFATVDGTASYSLPSDFQAFANGTVWDRTNDWELLGPATPKIWQTLQSGTVSAGVRRWYRVAGDFIQLYPTPTSADTIAFDYYSSYYAETSGGTAIEDWTADTNVSRIDGEIFTLGVTYYFMKAEGLPCLEEKQAYMQAILDHQSDDTPKPTVRFNANALVNPMMGNIPETGFGQ